MKTTKAAFGMLLGFVFLTMAFVAGAQETHSLKRVFKAGEEDRYQTTVDVEALSGMKLQISFVTLEKTLEIKEDGSMTRSITVESAQVQAMGQTMPMPNFQPVTMKATVDKDGKIVKEEGNGGQFRQLLSMTRPLAEADEPLKVGQEWKTEVPTNKDGSKKLAVTVTLVGLEPKSENVPWETFKVKTTAEGTVEADDGDRKVKMESVSLVTRDAAKLVKSEGSIEGLSFPQFGPVKVTFKVLKQPEKPAPTEKK